MLTSSRQLLDVIFTVGCYDTLAWLYSSMELELEADLRGARPIPHP
jgi:hypothetical protein